MIIAIIKIEKMNTINRPIISVQEEQGEHEPQSKTNVFTER